MEGIKAAPFKIQSVAFFINKLSFACWTINTDDLNSLMKLNNNIDWNSKELVFLVSLVVQVHKISLLSESIGLSSYYYDSKIFKYTYEVNYNNYLKKINNLDSELRNILDKEDKQKKIDYLKEKLEEINEIDSNKNDYNSKKSSKAKQEEINFEDFVHKKIKLKEIDASPIVNESELITNLCSLTFIQDTNMHDIFSIFVADICKKYTDFDTRTFDYESHLDFNWEDQAFHILNDILENVISNINKEVEYCFKMTYNSLGNYEKINTSHIRFAMCVYIEKIYGLEREDYNYSYTNKLLLKEDKTFMKFVACYPEKITSNMIGKISFTEDEILHIILLVTNSKLTTQFRFFTHRLYQIINYME